MPPCSFATLRTEVRSLYAPNAPKTWYVVRQILDEMEALGVRSTAQINSALIGRWLEAHDDRSSMTNRKLLSAWRTVCNYAQFEGYIDKNPFGFRGLRQWVRGVKQRKKRHHSWEDISRVLSLLANERSESWENERLFALVSTYVFTGLRKLEALRLKVEDFDLDAGFGSIVARERLKTAASEDVIPLPDQLISVLREWLPRTGCEWAFPHAYRTGPWTEGPSGRKPLDRVKAAGERAGVDGFTILSLRHSWATHAESRWGIPEAVIKRVLRHTSLQTQLNYRHPDMVNLREQVRGIGFAVASAPRGREEVRRGQEAAIGA